LLRRIYFNEKAEINYWAILIELSHQILILIQAEKDMYRINLTLLFIPYLADFLFSYRGLKFSLFYENQYIISFVFCKERIIENKIISQE